MINFFCLESHVGLFRPEITPWRFQFTDWNKNVSYQRSARSPSPNWKCHPIPGSGNSPFASTEDVDPVRPLPFCLTTLQRALRSSFNSNLYVSTLHKGIFQVAYQSGLSQNPALGQDQDLQIEY